jgi:hypothetical protein
VQGGAIYTLGAQGNLPFEMPWKFMNTSSILPPSVQSRNWIHDAGDTTTAALDHDGIGKHSFDLQSHCLLGACDFAMLRSFG